MDTAVLAALIASGASVVVATISAVMTVRAHRQERELAAEAVLERYRKPLVGAAMDLQTRLHNLLGGDFFATYARRDSERRADVILTTLYRFAQYFGWTEILNREIQYLQFRHPRDTRRVQALLIEIMRVFNTDRLGNAFMIWRDEQRAIGELMGRKHNGNAECMGYAEFVQKCRSGTPLAQWLSRLETWLDDLATRDLETLAQWPPGIRLQLVQSVLCDLIRELDPEELQSSRKVLNTVAQPLSLQALNELRTSLP